MRIRGTGEPPRQLDRAGSDGFLRRDHREVLLVEQDPKALLDRLERWSPPPAVWRATGDVSPRAAGDVSH